MIDDARRDYQTLSRLVKGQTFVIAALTAALLFFALQGRPENRYAAMSFGGGLLPLQAFKEPYIDSRIISSWTAQVVGQILTLGFDDSEERLGATRMYFTDVGWASFTKAVLAGGLIQTIRANQQLITSVVARTPKITFEGVRDGKYVWDVEALVVMTARAGSDTRTMQRQVIMTIVQVPPRMNPSGIGIEGIIVL